MAKTPANRLGMYADVREILDAALRHGGGEYQCTDHGTAVHWRQRAYRFRKLYAEVHRSGLESPYDSILIRRIAPDSGTVVIELREQVGVFTPRNPVARPPDMDELFDVADALASKIEKGEL